MESNAHHVLVEMAVKYVSERSDVESAFIEADISSVPGSVTRTIEGFVPDVFYDYGGTVIIGEAKTSKDLEREHSLQQYKAYVRKLVTETNEGKKCALVMAVPWQDSIAAYRIAKTCIKGKTGIAGIILNEAGVFRCYEED